MIWQDNFLDFLLLILLRLQVRLDKIRKWEKNGQAFTSCKSPVYLLTELSNSCALCKDFSNSFCDLLQLISEQTSK